MEIRWNEKNFIIDGKEDFLISGEFHYFRVPKNEWEQRLNLMLECGCNALATYVPWCLHEPEEGKILFDDRDDRDLTDFLRLTKEKGIPVMLRPGPYVYSELKYNGVPEWLVKRYPRILKREIDGQISPTAFASYLHPIFLEKAKAYLSAFAEVVKPFLCENGGNV